MKFSQFFATLFRRAPPPPALLDWLLRSIEYNLASGKVEVFPAIRKHLTRLARVEGYVSDLLFVLSQHVNSRDPDIAEGCLALMDKIMRRHSKELGSFDIFRIVNTLILLDAPTEAAKEKASRMLRDAFLDHPWPAYNFLRRMKATSDGEMLAKIHAAMSS